MNLYLYIIIIINYLFKKRKFFFFRYTYNKDCNIDVYRISFKKREMFYNDNL